MHTCRNIYNGHSPKIKVAWYKNMYLSFPRLASLSKSNLNTTGSLQTYMHVSQNLKEGQVNLAVLFQIYPYLPNGGGWGPRMPHFLCKILVLMFY